MSQQQRTNKNEIAFMSNIFFEFYHQINTLNELSTLHGIPESTIILWKEEFLNKADELFVEHKRKIIDSYISWEKSKLLALYPLGNARTCIEQVVKARIIDTLKITEFSYFDLDRYKAKGVVKKDSKFFTLVSYIDIIRIENKKNILPINIIDDIDEIRQNANTIVHEETYSFYSEIQKYHNKLTKIVDEFFKIYGISDWKKEVESQKETMFYDIAVGIAKETKKIEVKKILEEDKQIAKIKYFNYIKIKCGIIRLEGTNKDIPIEEFVIPLDFQKIKNDNYTNIESNCSFLIGEPGSGKSTILKCFAISYAFPEFYKLLFDDNNIDNYFPLYIRCRELRGKVTLPILEIIGNIPSIAEIPNFKDQFNALVYEKLSVGYILLLLDGFDEIEKGSERKIFLENIITFLKTYPKTNIVISSRETVLNEKSILDLTSKYFEIYRISELTNEQIELLCINWLKAYKGNSEEIIQEAKEIANRINNDLCFNLDIIAKKPMLLISLLFIYVKEGHLPNNKITIYSETIKILVELWNIEGHEHEQLDYDETISQLSYIAYWMTKNEQLIIKENDLKLCLKNAREKIDRKLDYSINDFISRVKNRSGLLKMTSSSDFEFVHNSFQDFLTINAIYYNYLPKEDSNKEPLEIIVSNISKEKWYFLIRETAFNLDKNEFKKLINFLILESKNTTHKEWVVFINYRYDEKNNISNGNNKEKAFIKYHSIRLLGELLYMEADFEELLAEALEWYAKNSIEDSTAFTISITKYGNEFKEKIKYLIFDNHQEEYLYRLIVLLSNLNTQEFIANLNENTGIESLFKKVKNGLLNEDKIQRRICILLLTIDFMLICPELAGLSDAEENDFIKLKDKYEQLVINESTEIFNELLITMPLENSTGYFITAYVFGYYLEKGAFTNDFYKNVICKIIKNINCLEKYIIVLINGWTIYQKYNWNGLSSWILSKVLHPNIKINIETVYPNIKEIITSKYKNSECKYDKVASLYIGLLAGINLGINDDSDEIKNAIDNWNIMKQ